MDLPFFKRGLELVSSQLNKLSNAIRASTITSVIGGTLMRTPGGTTLVIDQQPGGGGGGVAPSDYCFFKVTDVSTDTQLKIQVQSDQVEGRWPDGMDGVVDYVLNVPSAYASGGWFAVYALLKVDENGIILPGDDAISIQLKPDFQKEGSSLQWYYIAGVNVSLDETNAAYISRIDNSCPVVYAWPPSPCPFEVEDATVVEGTPRILVRTGKIEGAYPAGMTEGTHFTVAIPGTVGDWCAVYSKILLAQGAVDWTQQNPISIQITTDYQTSTSSVQYDLLAEVNLDYDGGKKYISYINKKCTQPSLADIAEHCPFQLTDVSTYNQSGNPTNCRIKVECDTVDGRYPNGMGSGVNYVLAPTSADVSSAGVGYVYLKILVDEYGVPFSYATAITIEVGPAFIPSGSCIQRHLIGKFEMNRTTQAIVPRKIVNICPIPTLGILSSCPFEVEDSSEDVATGMKVLVRTGFVDGDRYPQGMSYQSRYLLTIPGGQGDWRGVYMILVLDSNGAIATGATSITLGVYNTEKVDTATLKYVLLADVYTAYTAASVEYISSIVNYCVTPEGNKTQTVTNYNCVLEVTDESSAGNPLRVKVLQSMVGLQNSSGIGRWPTGMGVGFPAYYLTLPDDTWGYIYAAVKYNTTTLVEDTSADIYIAVGDVNDPITLGAGWGAFAFCTFETAGGNVTVIQNQCQYIWGSPCFIN